MGGSSLSAGRSPSHGHSAVPVELRRLPTYSPVLTGELVDARRGEGPDALSGYRYGLGRCVRSAPRERAETEPQSILTFIGCFALCRIQDGTGPVRECVDSDSRCGSSSAETVRGVGINGESKINSNEEEWVLAVALMEAGIFQPFRGFDSSRRAVDGPLMWHRLVCLFAALFSLDLVERRLSAD